ncbi:MAG: M24 family metallopeptidase [Thermodesulfobacteriota bacterium]
MWTALERIPAEELSWRWHRCQELLQRLLPACGGILVFSRPNIYYLTGHWGNGVLWLPLEGAPVFLARKGLARAKLEIQDVRLDSLGSFRDIPKRLDALDTPLSETVAVEMGGLNWTLGEMLTSRLESYHFRNGDQALHQARAVKSDWEIRKMAIAGERHAAVLREDMPKVLRPGMTEREIGVLLWQAMFERGHQGMMRMQNPGEEIFLGHVAAGDSGNYPSVFNGPVGLRGAHPAVPHMGYAGQAWQQGTPLVLDVGFGLEGYHTDKTQVYWAGSRVSLPRQAQAAHEFCIGLQQWLATELRPGAVPSELFARAWRWAEEEGWGEGFMGLQENKVPFVGHGIGLAIDEPPVIARKFDQPLEANMVLALEPKIGIPQLGMVGVENSFVVTAEGGRSLTGTAWDMLCVQ